MIVDFPTGRTDEEDESPFSIATDHIVQVAGPAFGEVLVTCSSRITGSGSLRGVTERPKPTCTVHSICSDRTEDSVQPRAPDSRSRELPPKKPFFGGVSSDGKYALVIERLLKRHTSRYSRISGRSLTSAGRRDSRCMTRA